MIIYLCKEIDWHYLDNDIASLTNEAFMHLSIPQLFAMVAVWVIYQQWHDIVLPSPLYLGLILWVDGWVYLSIHRIGQWAFIPSSPPPLPPPKASQYAVTLHLTGNEQTFCHPPYECLCLYFLRIVAFCNKAFLYLNCLLLCHSFYLNHLKQCTKNTTGSTLQETHSKSPTHPDEINPKAIKTYLESWNGHRYMVSMLECWYFILCFNYSKSNN